jgi:hypothetical protein
MFGAPEAAGSPTSDPDFWRMSSTKVVVTLNLASFGYILWIRNLLVVVYNVDPYFYTYLEELCVIVKGITRAGHRTPKCDATREDHLVSGK